MFRVILFTLMVTNVAAFNGTWSQLHGKVIYVSASVNLFWGLNHQHHTHYCKRPCEDNKWVHIDGIVVNLDLNDYEVWGVNANDDVYARAVDGSTGWRHVAGKMKQVSASGNGYIWGVNAANEVFKCKKPCTGGWIKVDGALRQVDGGYGFVYGVTSCGDIYTRPVDGSGTWRKIPGNLIQITGSGFYNLYGVNMQNEVWMCEKPCFGEWQRIGGIGVAKQCDATADTLICVKGDDTLWEYK